MTFANVCNFCRNLINRQAEFLSRVSYKGLTESEIKNTRIKIYVKSKIQKYLIRLIFNFYLFERALMKSAKDIKIIKPIRETIKLEKMNSS